MQAAKLLRSDPLAELEEIIRTANVERGARLIVQLRAEFPALAQMFDVALGGTPEQALNMVGLYCPAIMEMPDALAVIEQLQIRLRVEIDKPRAGLKL
jgi:shikimate kinase